MSYPVSVMKNSSHIDSHFRDVLQPQHTNALARYEKYENKQIRDEEDTNKTLHQRILNSKQKKPPHLGGKAKDFPPEAYMLPGNYQRGYYVNQSDTGQQHYQHQIPGYYGPGIPNQQAHHLPNNQQPQLLNNHLSNQQPHLPPQSQQPHLHLNSNNHQLQSNGHHQLQNNGHLNNQQHLNNVANNGNNNNGHLTNNNGQIQNNNHHLNSQPVTSQQQLANLQLQGHNVKMQPQVMSQIPETTAPVSAPEPQDIKPKNKNKRSPSPNKLENASKKPNYGIEDFNGEDVDAILSSLLDESQEMPELNLFDDSAEWGDNNNQHGNGTTTSGETGDVKPSVVPSLEKNVEPSPLSKVPPPNVTISTTNMKAPSTPGAPSQPTNGQTPPKPPQQSGQTPNVQISQPSVQMSQPPSLQLVQPSKQHGQPNMQMSQPNMQMSQPNMQMSQPNMQMSQPNMQMSQPNMHMSQPNIQMSQPNKQMSQPSMQQFNPTNAQISAAAARSSPKSHIAQNTTLVSQAPPPYTQSNGMLSGTMETVSTQHLPPNIAPSTSYHMTVAMTTNKGLPSSQYGIQPRSPHLQIAQAGIKASTHCTDSGMSGGIPGGILNRAQVPNVTVTPGYSQPTGNGPLVPGNIPNFPSVRPAVDDHDKLANSKLLLKNKIKENARQGQSEKQRQKLEAEFHRSQQQSMNRATLEQQQQQQQQAAHQQQQQAGYPGMNMAHFNENPGFAMQPNFNQRNYYIMQQQAQQQQQQQLHMYYQQMRQQQAAHAAAAGNPDHHQQQIAAQHWARQAMTPQQQQALQHQQYYQHQMALQHMYQQKAKTEGVPTKAEPMYPGNMQNSRNIVCGPQGGRYIMAQSAPQQAQQYAMYQSPHLLPAQAPHPQQQQQLSHPHQMSMMTSGHHMTSQVNPMSSQPMMTSQHSMMTSQQSLMTSQPEPTLTQPTLNEVAIKSSSSPKIDSNKQNELDNAILDTNFSSDEIDMLFDMDPFLK
ncbi:hypothetical protein ACHWQZ_G001282 [Mnemiopsis leidyi]